jgi:hypothetical protein
MNVGGLLSTGVGAGCYGANLVSPLLIGLHPTVEARSPVTPVSLVIHSGGIGLIEIQDEIRNGVLPSEWYTMPVTTRGDPGSSLDAILATEEMS